MASYLCGRRAKRVAVGGVGAFGEEAVVAVVGDGGLNSGEVGRCGEGAGAGASV